MQRTMRNNISGEHPINPIGGRKRLRAWANQHRSNDRDETCRGGTGRLIYYGSYTVCGVRSWREVRESFPPLEYVFVKTMPFRQATYANPTYPTYPRSYWEPLY